jgi:hypothetical protein
MIKLKITIWKAILFIAICCLLYLESHAQTSEQLKAEFSTYTSSNFQEKVFVHADKSTYLTGEIIWLKVYSVDASSNKLVNLSKVAYIDVLDKNNNRVLQAKIAMNGGSGCGSIYLPVNEENGKYRLRAYTNWMKNFSPDLYFEKVLTVINPLISPAGNGSGKVEAVDVQFLPEGGQLVSGLTSRIAFKATKTSGLGLKDFTGAIVNQQSDTVARFKPLKNGIGSFVFTPDAGNAYKAVIKIRGQQSLSRNLPAVSSSGSVMQLLDDGSGKLIVNVSSTQPDNKVYLLAQTRNVVKAIVMGTIKAGKVRFDLDLAKLGTGVSQITILNENRQPICERLFFKQPLKDMSIDASSDQKSYGLRKKINLSVATSVASGRSAAANLSLSVYRIDSLQQLDEQDILSYLWLSSELKGNIESPRSYLDTNSSDNREAVDNLMLSQGWRKFEPMNAMAGKQAVFKFLPEYQGHIISATVTSSNKKPVDSVTAYLGITGKMVQMYTAKSDASGKLLFNTKNFYGPAEVIVQTNLGKDSTLHIQLESPFSESYASTRLPEFSFSSVQINAIKEHSVAVQASNIYSGGKLRSYYNPVSDSTAFYGKPDMLYILDNYTRFPTIEEVLREYVPEANVTKRGDNFYLTTMSKEKFLEHPPLVLLDGIPVFDTNKMMRVDPLKIYKLETIRNTYVWGPATHDGILSFTSYKGDLGGLELDPKALVVDYEGMQQQRQFYSPVYDTEAQVKSRIPDFRNLLFWEANVIVGGKEKKNISFYSSEQAGTYVGLIQGISADGDVGSAFFEFTVKE